MRESGNHSGDTAAGEPLVRTSTSTVLLEQLRDSNNHGVWREFDARYRPLLMAYAMCSFGLKPDDAEDVAQMSLAAFASAYREGKYDREKGRLRHWLFGIATHRAQEVVRQNRRCLEVQAPAQGDGTAFLHRVPSDAELEAAWNEEWQRAVYRQCLAEVRLQVDARSVEAFELMTRGVLSGQEVAERLGMSRNAVYVARHRVLKRIRELAPIMAEIW